LGVVRAMLDAANRVVFDRPNSYIVNKATKAVVPIDERNGAFVFDIWLPKGNVQGQGVGVQCSNRYQALIDDNADNQDFVRQDDLF